MPYSIVVAWKRRREGKKGGKSLFGRPLKQHDDTHTHRIARHHIQLQTFIVLCKVPTGAEKGEEIAFKSSQLLREG